MERSAKYMEAVRRLARRLVCTGRIYPVNSPQETSVSDIKRTTMGEKYVDGIFLGTRALMTMGRLSQVDGIPLAYLQFGFYELGQMIITGVTQFVGRMT